MQNMGKTKLGITDEEKEKIKKLIKIQTEFKKIGVNVLRKRNKIVVQIWFKLLLDIVSFIWLFCIDWRLGVILFLFRWSINIRASQI